MLSGMIAKSKETLTKRLTVAKQNNDCICISKCMNGPENVTGEVEFTLNQPWPGPNYEISDRVSEPSSIPDSFRKIWKQHVQFFPMNAIMHSSANARPHC
ncbi:hypothetical protein ATANTOWER_022640 [Ataeniobius toweri]|uniref:Uncharacterized protein n=1 Tax=Ataeniobius toweri TaxID=208326 RepID=A0ABU7AHQ0_9TELE|nr:hypothetical protein [Ataeniobius toweri]